MKIMDWNVEWMNRWFSGNHNPQWGSNSLGASDARIVAQRVANVILAVDPDILCIQEGPSAVQEMNLFIKDFLSENGAPLYDVLIGKAGGAQKLFVLKKIGGAVADFDHATDTLTHELEDVWQADVDGDLLLQPYDFTRAPMVVDINPVAGDPIRIVNLHTKSKYVHNGESLFNNPARRHEFIASAMKARRRISAEGFRLRTYLDQLVQNNPSERIIVTGDWNDGPGPDFFERQYLTHNVADIVLGSTFYPDLIFRHPVLERVPSNALFTARFDDFVDDVQDRPLLLDHFAVSPGLYGDVQDAGIAHAEFENELDGSGSARTQRASDHRPIWLEI